MKISSFFFIQILGLVIHFIAAESGSFESFENACKNDDVEKVKLILEENSDYLNRRGGGGQTPLMASVLSGSIAVVEYLLSVPEVDVTIGENDGYTPMHGAGFQGRAIIAERLIAHGLDPSDMHKDGFTPIHRAAWGNEKRHTDTVRVFLKAGVSASEKSRDGKTADMMTMNKGTKKLLKKALKLEAKKSTETTTQPTHFEL